MAVWRLQVNTGGTNVADYCLKNHVAAMGWSLRELTQAERSGIHTFLDYCNLARTQYKSFDSVCRMVEDVKVKFRYVNCEDFTFNFCMNAFYYMADGKLDNLSSMSEKQVIKLVNGIIDKSQKDTKFNRFKTKTVTIRFVKAKNCWKVQKVSDKLADVMMANFASNLQNLATFSISSACGEKSAYVIPETSEYGTVQKKVLVKVLKNIYGRKPELSA